MSHGSTLRGKGLLSPRDFGIDIAFLFSSYFFPAHGGFKKGRKLAAWSVETSM